MKMISSSWIFDLTIASIVLAYILYKYLTRNFDYWKKEGVLYFEPSPLFGNFYKTLMFQTTFAEELKSFYNKADQPYFGIYMLDNPVLVIKSPELVKKVLVKDFTSFKNRTLAQGKHNDMIANWLLLQEYSGWKKTRSKLSQIFSSARLKIMFRTINNVSNLMIDYMHQHLGEIDSKVLCTKYTTEVIVSCFFGIDGKCFSNKHSEFTAVSRRTFEFSLRNGLIQGFYVFKPSIVEWLKLDFIRQSDIDFLIKAFENSLRAREASPNRIKGKITDYIDILLEMKEEDEKLGNSISESNYLLALANTLQFYLAGVETTSSVMAFTMYEWAMSPHIQEKVRKEVSTVLRKFGSFSFESLKEMEYLGMCLAETGRKYIALMILDRKAEIDYEIPETGYVIKKGTKIYIPYHALHMDEKYFPEPQKYKPERFMDEMINKDGLFYMPFGAGPRGCIGERFAQISMKLTLAKVLMNFRMEPGEKTPMSIKFEPKSFTHVSNVGLPIKLTLLEKK